jgi:hypothetical protein
MSFMNNPLKSIKYISKPLDVVQLASKEKKKSRPPAPYHIGNTWGEMNKANIQVCYRTTQTTLRTIT